MKHVSNDGGRKAAGHKGKAGDCVARPIAIATNQPYQKVYDDLKAIGWLDRRYEIGADGLAEPRCENREGRREYLASLGWTWTPTMHIGKGCQVHLRADELPPGRLIVAVSKHWTAVIDGVIHDTFDCSRDVLGVCTATSGRNDRQHQHDDDDDDQTPDKPRSKGRINQKEEQTI